MLLKELAKNLRPRNDNVEESLHRPVATAFASPAGNAQHRHSTRHAQHRLDNPAHTTDIRF